MITLFAWFTGSPYARGATLDDPSATEATWVHSMFEGRLMANGEPYNAKRLIAASSYFEFGDQVLVTFGRKCVVVEITDRMQKGKTGIDLSSRAFQELAPLPRGRIQVTVQRIIHE